MRLVIVTTKGHVITGEYRGTGVAKWPVLNGSKKVVYKNIGGQLIDTDVIDFIEYE